jgi:hypothetical protein
MSKLPRWSSLVVCMFQLSVGETTGRCLFPRRPALQADELEVNEGAERLIWKFFVLSDRGIEVVVTSRASLERVRS